MSNLVVEARGMSPDFARFVEAKIGRYVFQPGNLVMKRGRDDGPVFAMRDEIRNRTVTDDNSDLEKRMQIIKNVLHGIFSRVETQNEQQQQKLEYFQDWLTQVNPDEFFGSVLDMLVAEPYLIFSNLPETQSWELLYFLSDIRSVINGYNDHQIQSIVVYLIGHSFRETQATDTLQRLNASMERLQQSMLSNPILTRR